jgi:hypothetical protein
LIDYKSYAIVRVDMIEQQPISEAQKIAFIEEIRERSRKSSAVLREEAIKREGGIPPSMLRYYLSHPQFGIKTSEDYLKYFSEEDRERDAHMITSADLLDLYTSELTDFKKSGEPGFYMRRTEQLIDKVADGFIWATDANIRFAIKQARVLDSSKNDEELKEGLWYFIAKTLPHYSKALVTSTTYKDKLKNIHVMLNAVHFYAEGSFANGAQNLVRDLDPEFVGYGYAGRLLDFLSNDL